MLRSTLGRLIARIAVAGALFAAGAAQAASCPDHYLYGRAPEIRNRNMAAATRE
ncbi:DNA/RNA non-specific endonuclease, partial [Acinetobacter baumannii]|nr:DNA/RNA non-specific endonuclease [Acinetobacter baumannii]